MQQQRHLSLLDYIDFLRKREIEVTPGGQPDAAGRKLSIDTLGQ